MANIWWPPKKPNRPLTPGTGVSAMDLARQNFAKQAAAGLVRQLTMPSPAQPHQPDPNYPSTMGWRSWVWDMTANELRSPLQGTVWNGIELRAHHWDETDVIRGVAGIHAHMVPKGWRSLIPDELSATGRQQAYPLVTFNHMRACIGVTGIAERFGKYVLGKEGWRAEWAMIRTLLAPTNDIGMALEKAFPEVEIIYGDR